MIISDISQLMIAGYMVNFAKQAAGDVDVDSFRHMALNSIRLINSKFRPEYGQLVLAVDSGKSWRKVVLPYYKANRDVQKRDGSVNWPEMMKAIRGIVGELAEHFPYPVIVARMAEADDVIGVLARDNTARGEKTLIVSADKDFIQLQIDNDLVSQWDEMHDRWIRHDNPSRYMFEHVIKGDRGDGIPSFLSPDDTFVSKIRQKPITKAKLEEWWTNGPPKDSHFKRNIVLIDLKCTPVEIQLDIRQQLAEAPVKSKSAILPYMMKFGLRKLSANIKDF